MTKRGLGDPRGTIEYQLGRLSTKLDGLDEKLDTISYELKRDRQERLKLEEDIADLKEWKTRHIEWHNNMDTNINIPKEWLIGFILAIIGSGVAFKLIEIVILGGN